MVEYKLDDYKTLDIYDYYKGYYKDNIDYIFNNCIEKESINIYNFDFLKETLEGISKYIMEYNHYLNYEYNDNINIKIRQVKNGDNYNQYIHLFNIQYKRYRGEGINSWFYKFFEIKVDDEIYHYLFTEEFSEYELNKYFDIMFNKNLEKFSLKNKGES